MIAPGHNDDHAGKVTPIGGARTLPDMSAVELAILVALLQTGPAVIAIFARKLEDWFAMPFGAADLDPSLRRLRAKGWAADEGDGRLAPTAAAFEPTRTIYAGLVRMIASHFRNATDPDQLNLIDDTKE